MMISYPGLSKLKTREVVYQNVLLARDSGTLEQLKELSSKRKGVEESINENSFVTEAIAREMSGGLTSRCEQIWCNLPSSSGKLLACTIIYLMKFFTLYRVHCPPERPPEATSCVSSIISLICLADAQAVTVKKAEQNGSTGGLLAKLHYGVKEFLVEAIIVLQSATKECKDISSCLLDFLSCCKTLHDLKSYKYLADGLRNDGKIGIAPVGILHQALANVKSMPKEESWRLVSKGVIDDLTGLLRKYEHENDFVWHEKLRNNDELPLPQAVKVVNTIPYQQ